MGSKFGTSVSAPNSRNSTRLPERAVEPSGSVSWGIRQFQGSAKILQPHQSVCAALSPPASGTAWNESILYTFSCSTTCGPSSELILDKSNHLFGTTEYGVGGVGSGGGTIYRLTPPPMDRPLGASRRCGPSPGSATVPSRGAWRLTRRPATSTVQLNPLTPVVAKDAASPMS